MLLTIDAGNTRTKWAIFNELGEITQHDVCLNSGINSADLSPALFGYDHIAISNVAGEQHAMHLVGKLSPYHLPVHWVKATPQACHVINRYTKPETLGSDRWAALIATWNIKHAPCVVVNAGTAVTIDALNSCEINHEQYGEFIGGLILPGLDLMQQSLGLATAQLPKADAVQVPVAPTLEDIFAKITTGAIYNGAVHAIVGAIRQMVDALTQRSLQAPNIIISGGNALIINEMLTRHVTNQTIIVDNLVCQGLYLLATSTLNENSMKSDAQ
ncbi:MAG: type III pantothenate kinase [Methylotenera sp.]|nr:type III pantothenate kinase [Methylotenera sp.]MDP1959896.1 type III pantothenate kinase [Methylotenera sp.]MDP3206891.1 type III pantothenate kinase [Methylotenera sp.]MDP3302799.1 type III pantothenate kinase [Methylotenera sp.]MDP3942041.1 type III pantothenate kinase [Methylotenera sp.]